MGVAAGFGLGVTISADSTVASDGAGAGVPDGVGTGVGGGVSCPTAACGLAESCGLPVTPSLGVALAETTAEGLFACWSDGNASASTIAPIASTPTAAPPARTRRSCE
jgi:hypothetical protein